MSIREHGHPIAVYLASLLWIGLAQPAHAGQITAGSTQVCSASIDMGPQDVELEELRRERPYDELRQAASALLIDMASSLTETGECLPFLPDSGNDYQYRLVWIGRNAKAEEGIYHVVVRSQPDPFLAQRLRGASTTGKRNLGVRRGPSPLIDVFITSLERTSFDQEIVAVPEANPETARLGEVVEKAKLIEAIATGVGPLGTSGAALISAPAIQSVSGIDHLGSLELAREWMRKPASVPAATRSTLVVRFVMPNISVSRGTIEMKQVANVGFSAERVKDARQLLENELGPSSPGNAPDLNCAIELNRQLGTELPSRLAAEARCKVSAQDELQSCALAARWAIEQTIAATRATTSCGSPVNMATGISAAVLAYYRASVLPRTVTTTVKLSNVPAVRWSFSGVSAVLRSPVFPKGATRAKLNAKGEVTEDSLPALLTGFAINFHPLSFESTGSTDLSFRESFRVFAGPAFTPETGVIAGLGYAFRRNVGIVAGRTWLAFDAHVPGKSELGSVAGVNEDPFETRWLSAYFIGLLLKF